MLSPQQASALLSGTEARMRWRPLILGFLSTFMNKFELFWILIMMLGFSKTEMYHFTYCLIIFPSVSRQLVKISAVCVQHGFMQDGRYGSVETGCRSQGK